MFHQQHGPNVPQLVPPVIHSDHFDPVYTPSPMHNPRDPLYTPSPMSNPSPLAGIKRQYEYDDEPRMYKRPKLEPRPYLPIKPEYHHVRAPPSGFGKTQDSKFLSSITHLDSMKTVPLSVARRLSNIQNRDKFWLRYSLIISWASKYEHLGARFDILQQKKNAREVFVRALARCQACSDENATSKWRPGKFHNTASFCTVVISSLRLKCCKCVFLSWCENFERGRTLCHCAWLKVLFRLAQMLAGLHQNTTVSWNIFFAKNVFG